MDFSITTTERSTAPRAFLASQHGVESARTATLSKAAFGVATGEKIEAGTPVAKITASGLVGPYTPAATDGTEVLYGLLLNEMTAGASDEIIGAVLINGIVVESALPVAIDAAGKADNANIQYV